ncbi:hypothetical protein OSB04_024564 [Centaurea solstitialis]|uniref:Reverse transcriptase Ty1/copia-type domain-containing protein n=1 Tax=Centaurea solstitialis TaxID=347529 RepID=A0AA38T4U7_9ASTR|nr:hypothetical protein OSB04_024564 [Centaurea solstitialis]
MFMKAKLPVSAWDHPILHAATLIRIRPKSYNASSLLETVFGQEPNISHLRIFGYAVYVSIASPQHTKMGPKMRLGIYPLTRDLFTVRFADCHINESKFPALGEGLNSWKIKQCKLEVQKIIHLQGLANQLPDTFTNPKRMTKSHVSDANSSVKIDVPKGQDNVSNDVRARQKCGRPLDSKEKNPRKKKGANNQHGQIEVIETPEKTLDMMKRNREKTNVDDIFAYNVALNVMENEEDQEPKSIDECLHGSYWPKWKDTMQVKLSSLMKREVFGPIVRTPEAIKRVKYIRIFIRSIMRKHKDSHKDPGIDYEETYSPVVGATIFQYLISLVIQEGIVMRLMDVVKVYLYGSLDTHIYMKLPIGLKLPESYKVSSQDHCSIKLNKSLYGLKQLVRMWYNHLSEYL